MLQSCHLNKFSDHDLLIHDWNYREMSIWRLDVLYSLVAVSVPCQMYSCARTRAATPCDIPATTRIVERVLDIG